MRRLTALVLIGVTICCGVGDRHAEADENPPGSFLEIEIDPLLDGWGRPWFVEIGRIAESGGVTGVYEDEAGTDGRVRVASPGAGDYLLIVLDSQKMQHFSSTDIEVPPSGWSRRIELEPQRIRGTARIGEAPVEGRVWFRRQSLRGERGFEVDREGRFEGVVPGGVGERRWWTIEGRDARTGERVSTRLEAAIEPDGTVRLDVPRTSLFGQVVDSAGEPISEAQITWRVLGGVLFHEVSTDEDGRFHLRGLPERVRLVARHGRQESAESVFHLQERVPVGPVEFVVE